MNRILVTGASGFAGSHLIEYLQAEAKGEIFGTVFGNTVEELGLDEHHSYSINLLHQDEVRLMVENVKPDYVYHLAALSSPAASFQDPQAFFSNNVDAQFHLLEAVRLHCPKAKVLVVGTAEEYGKVKPQELPMSEATPLNPISPYAASKVAQDYLGLMYHNAYQLPVIRVRPFNHIGERQTEAFVTGAFARQIALIEAGAQEPVINVGNLTPKRDFTDVKDMVKAYVLALELGTPGEVYNLGSGTSISIQELLDTLLSLATLPIMVEEDPARVQPVDVPEMRADISKFHALTGWGSTIPLKNTLVRVLDYWRKKVTSNQKPDTSL
jgi:GDP-4-dehydro-6-deoxy-D-mannose reductase